MSHREPTSKTNIPRRLAMVTAALALILLLGLSASGASAKEFLPPAHKIFAGVGGQPLSAYEKSAGKHPPVYQVFSAWGEYLPGIFKDAEDARSRLMISISTDFGGHEAITPGGIARGQGDDWLIALNQAAYQSGLVVYVRLMAEMNGYWNWYSAFGQNGPRDADHSTSAFKRAWKRVTLIMRGGSLSRINDQLRKLGMPALHTAQDLPRPKVAMVWCPQSSGDPDVSGNSPRAYYPGRPWVDWVGTDFYSKFPNFSGLDQLYATFPKQPFAFGEYAVWGADNPSWVNQLFSWIHSHSRVRMLIYYQGLSGEGEFKLARHPRSARALRHQLSSSTFPAFAPEWANS